ncbi:MAG: sigma-54 dependent transcriptional regulator [Phycisphaerales bacterium]|nr:sigma-54 dependent transcriptional regulator [Phycisphaerales bacterium]
MTRILVVDDKEMMRDSVSTMLARKGHTIVTASNGAMAIAKMDERVFDAVITDLQMPEVDGLELLEAIRARDDSMPVILMTAYGSVESAVDAMKLGAYDYISKPFSGDELVATVERALERGRLVKANAILQVRGVPAGGKACGREHEMIGGSESLVGLRLRLRQIAESNSTVLVTGESGTGKEVASRWIHEQSSRSDGSFLAINCAALSTSLLESELFGHEKGAFTGATAMRKGRFELADGGTLLLDEISEIAPEIQAKLLRVLQERSFERVGSSTPRTVDVRIIATSNRDLEAEVAAGRFRQDLFFRLNVLPLVMPPLRDHAEDVSELVIHFLRRMASAEGREPRRVDPDAMELLKQYSWPGNVRELENICERAHVLSMGDLVTAELIEPWLQCEAHDQGSAPHIAVPIASQGVTEHEDHEADTFICDGQRRLEDIERAAIIATLEQYDGHRQRSASALGIGVRTLGLKLKKWKESNLIPSAT